ncbi:uncharacterized protein LOC132903208 [Amyelois transitella]|uniref:uncharacterized protein LOC132903208 n=1 Tax=Amyelois transitella TaxID=680683 RepID=UPI0029907765|nr:uncharacterized protein LOC132903208 [Amyelois transitella]
MKYADNPKPRHSTSKPQSHNLCNSKRIDCNKTKSLYPSKQVSDNQRPCQTVCGKGTENKLLLQISEAREVSDFERILNSNAILSERARDNVWRSCLERKPSASVAPRPHSSYSLHTVSQTYHYLFKQHEESLQPLIDTYRRANAEQPCPPSSFLGNWYDNLKTLSEFYEDDEVLQEELEIINDRIIAEEVKTVEESQQSGKNKNFNVNLADLIGLHVTGENCAFLPNRDDTPEIDKGGEDEKEWLAPIMSANPDDQQDKDTNVDCLAQNLQSVNIDSDAKVPTITFSNCCDNCVTGELSANPDVVIHLTVPSANSIDESRPPMM